MDENQELSPDAKALIAEREKMLGSDFHEQPSIAEATPSEPEPPKNTRPTVGQFGRKVVESVKNVDSSPIAKFLNDPAHLSALLGIPIGAYRSGANFNPIDPTFLKYNPRPSQPAPRTAPAASFEEPQTPVYETATGQASKAGRTAGENMLTNQSANKSWASAPEGKIATLESHGISGPSMSQLYGEMGPTEVKMIGGRPMEIPLGAANSAAEPVANAAGSLSNAIKTALPGANKATQWIKSVLPTLGIMGKTAGVLGGTADTLTRAAQGDTTGAGISGAGTALAAMTPFPADIATGGLAWLANYYRDNPEELAKMQAEMKKRIQAERHNPNPFLR